MADRFVRVTLEAPYINNAGHEVDEVSVRYGTEPATLAHGGYVRDAGLNEDAVPVSERAGAPPRFIPGKPIIYTMRWSVEEMRTMIVPDFVAVNYFGDWTVKPGGAIAGETTPERTHPAEKKRIESVWGMCRKERRDPNIPNHWRSLRKIAAPAVPRVVITLLDSAYRAVPNFEYRPWEHFGWDNDVYATDAKQPQGLVSASGAPLEISAEMKALMDTYIQQQIAAGLAAQAAPTARSKAA